MARSLNHGSLMRQIGSLVLIIGALLMREALQSFVWHRVPTCGTASRNSLSSRIPRPVAIRPADRKPVPWDTQPTALDVEDPTKFVEREVKVTDIRDINELLKLKKPLQPDAATALVAVTFPNGTKISPVFIEDLKKLRPTEYRPVYFTWQDAREDIGRAPKDFDELIQRLLNSGPAEMQNLIRANWKNFDDTFFFRVTELAELTSDLRLKDRLKNLFHATRDVIHAAQDEAVKQTPATAQDAKDLVTCLFEGGDLLWPPSQERFAKLAEEVSRRAQYNKYADLWFENLIEILDIWTKQAMQKDDQDFLPVFRAVLQRVVTEWLRHDSLWEETVEGRFLYHMMELHNEQWLTALQMQEEPLTASKMKDEIKIISETKVLNLPMSSKLQIYVAKYLQGVVDFIDSNEDYISSGVAAR